MSSQREAKSALASVGVPANDIDWHEEPWGGKTALLWEDTETGHSAFLIHHPAGFYKPEEKIKHTANMRGVIIAGWMKICEEGENPEGAEKLTAGSHFHKVAGVTHQELHSPDEATIVYVHYDGPRDTFIDGKKMHLD